MRIRNATLEDAAAIVSLTAQLGYMSNDTEVRRLHTILLQRDDHAVFVAEEPDGAVIGWVHVFAARRLFVPMFAELGGLVLDEERRGWGVGCALLAERWAAENGCAMLRIRSNVLRGSAHQFYERMGYRVAKSQLVFEKSLVPHEARKYGKSVRSSG